MVIPVACSAVYCSILRVWGLLSGLFDESFGGAAVASHVFQVVGHEATPPPAVRGRESISTRSRIKTKRNTIVRLIIVGNASLLSELYSLESQQ